MNVGSCMWPLSMPAYSYLFFQERIQLSYPSLSSPLCEVFLSIISNLISLHPDIHHIIQICDFLLLTHPAANTFVYHNPTTFCFRNKWSEIPFINTLQFYVVICCFAHCIATYAVFLVAITASFFSFLIMIFQSGYH